MGSDDPNSGWATARRHFMAQVLLRMGKIKETNSLLDQFRDANNVLPSYFQMDNLTPIDEYKISYFDEMHKKCQNW